MTTANEQMVQLHQVLKDGIKDVTDALGYIRALEEAHGLTPTFNMQMLTILMDIVLRCATHIISTADVNFLEDVAEAIYTLVKKRRDVFGDIPLMD